MGSENKKISLVCEGGGMRGAFTAGALQAFLDGGFVANELIGTSAGASNGVSYVSGQNGRMYRTNIDYAGDKRYASMQSWVRTGSVFGMDFLFGDLADELDPLDFEAFAASPCDYYATATDVETGKPVYFGKADISRGLYAVRASCSMPIFSPIVEFKGGKYLDGGITVPIPIDKALEGGCTRMVVVLTRPRDYRKKAERFRPVYHAVYRRYPKLVQAMDLRHLVYNHTLERLARLEESGKAIVVAPPEALTVDRFGKDRDKLIAAYDIGYAQGQLALPLIQAEAPL